MLTVVMLSMIVSSAAVAARWALRGRLPNSVADVRGIALQTVIIMVVLLAIAGGVSAVLLNRGGEAVTDIERQQISREASEFSGSALCNAAGFVWSSASSSCHATAAVVVVLHGSGTPHTHGDFIVTAAGAALTTTRTPGTQVNLPSLCFGAVAAA